MRTGFGGFALLCGGFCRRWSGCTPMSEFKVGDRVMVPAYVNAVGLGDNPGIRCVVEDGDYEGWYEAHEIAPAPPAPTGKTVKVRAAVCIADDGRWAIAGGSDWGDATSKANAYFFGAGSSDLTHFIEAEVPLPDPQTIPDKVVPSDE